VRFRHADSDLVRTQRQQALVASIKMKMLSPSTLIALPNIVNTIDRHVDSDFTLDQKIALAHFVRSAPKQNVTMVTLPSIEGSYYVYTDWAQATPLIQTWFGVTPPANIGRSRPRHMMASRLRGIRQDRPATL
jgi:anionic cell wall polymer biosynthesis LytR-Cps2A-Psr (LCP) family protein